MGAVVPAWHACRQSPVQLPFKGSWLADNFGEIYCRILGWMDPKQIHGLLARVHSLGGGTQALQEKGPRFNQLGSQGDKDFFPETTTCWSWLY